MTQEQALLLAILDAPEDDAPRLIYADWLEERGEPRGEFIRIQCELARLGGDDPRRLGLQGGGKELFDQYAFDWLGALYYESAVWQCARGFLATADVPVKCMIEEAAG